jgi:hypothetical protein
VIPAGSARSPKDQAVRKWVQHAGNEVTWLPSVQERSPVILASGRQQVMQSRK